MAIYTERISQLEDLVANPVEREWLELKSWVDLTDHLHRANCARHIAAISNYGGGYLIFGFENSGTRSPGNENARSHYGHDVFAGIVDKYLQPKFQCEVAFPEYDGVVHAVVWIPPHGPTPVIAKADGPKDVKGKTQGIFSGIIYIRSPKPESVPATTPDHWDKIIQRCVLSKRGELLGMISMIMGGGTPSAKEPDDSRNRLETWHKTTQRAALTEAGRMKVELKYPLADNFVQFSYLIRHAKGETIPAAKMFEVVEKLNNAVRDTVRYGWSMFYPFTREAIMPRPTTDTAVDGGDMEFLQTSLMEGGVTTGRADFWRLSPDGRASLLRNFHEDRFEGTPHDVPTDTKWFDPWLHVRDITEIVRHAWAFSEEFTEVTDICFDIEWKGLKSRVVASVNPARYWSENYTSRTDWRNIYECVPQAEVIANLPGVVARLFAPVYRMFNPRSDIDAGYVSRAMRDFVVQGL